MTDDKIRMNNLDEFLRENYNHIYIAMQQEGYTIEYPEDHIIFKELKYDDRVVGFAAVDLVMGQRPQYSLSECYIMPEYRRNNILFGFIIHNMLNPNYEFSIRRPNRAIINLLLKYDLAFSLKGNIIISYIGLNASLDEVVTNKKIKKLYKRVEDEYKNELISSSYYNMNLGCMVFFDVTGDFAKNNYTLCITKPRVDDNRKYKLRRRFKDVTESTLDNIALNISQHNSKIHEFKEDVNSRFEEIYSVDNIIGTSDQLNDNTISILEANNLCIDDGFKFRDIIIKKLEDEDIVNYTIPEYFNFLVATKDIQKKEYVPKDDVQLQEHNGIKYYDNGYMDILVCPECNCENQDYNRVCSLCGFNLSKYWNKD